MSVLLEFFNEHVLAIDFGMLILIWIVQIIIYPAFHKVIKSEFVKWHSTYCTTIGFFVLPVMICQLIESASGCFFSSGNWVWLKLLFVAGAWVITFLISAPCHRVLQQGKESAVINRLIRTNWIRTILWSLVFVTSIFIYYT